VAFSLSQSHFLPIHPRSSPQSESQPRSALHGIGSILAVVTFANGAANGCPGWDTATVIPAFATPTDNDRAMNLFETYALGIVHVKIAASPKDFEVAKKLSFKLAKRRSISPTPWAKTGTGSISVRPTTKRVLRGIFISRCISIAL